MLPVGFFFPWSARQQVALWVQMPLSTGCCIEHGLLPFLTAALMGTTKEYHLCKVWEILGDVERREEHYVNCDPNFTLNIFITCFFIKIHKNRRKHISMLVGGRWNNE